VTGARWRDAATGDGMTPPAIVVEEGAIRVRRMLSDDSELALMARWLNEPHVREWWDPDGPAATVELVRRDYAPNTNPSSAGVSCFIEVAGRPVGFVQFYPWAAEREYCRKVGITVEQTAWGFDVFIGDPAAVGTGVATRVLELLCAHLVDDRGASAVVIVSEVTNVRAHHVYEKIGFRKVLDFLDDDTRGGARVRSYVMRKERDASRVRR
jgi:aminoglycoside 6'-N-acetyltransferase